MCPRLYSSVYRHEYIFNTDVKGIFVLQTSSFLHYTKKIHNKQAWGCFDAMEDILWQGEVGQQRRDGRKEGSRSKHLLCNAALWWLNLLPSHVINVSGNGRSSIWTVRVRFFHQWSMGMKSGNGTLSTPGKGLGHGWGYEWWWGGGGIGHLDNWALRWNLRSAHGQKLRVGRAMATIGSDIQCLIST